MTSKSGTRQPGFRQASLLSHRSFRIVLLASSVPVATVGSLRSPWHDHASCCAWRMKGFRRLKPTCRCSTSCVPCEALELEHGDTALSSRGRSPEDSARRCRCAPVRVEDSWGRRLPQRRSTFRMGPAMRPSECSRRCREPNVSRETGLDAAGIRGIRVVGILSAVGDSGCTVDRPKTHA